MLLDDVVSSSFSVPQRRGVDVVDRHLLAVAARIVNFERGIDAERLGEIGRERDVVEPPVIVVGGDAEPRPKLARDAGVVDELIGPRQVRIGVPVAADAEGRRQLREVHLASGRQEGAAQRRPRRCRCSRSCRLPAPCSPELDVLIGPAHGGRHQRHRVVALRERRGILLHVAPDAELEGGLAVAGQIVGGADSRHPVDVIRQVGDPVEVALRHEPAGGRRLLGHFRIEALEAQTGVQVSLPSCHVS